MAGQTAGQSFVNPLTLLPLSDDDFVMRISDKEFRLLRELIYNQFGINLTEQKRSLVVSRLQTLLPELGLKTFKEYYEHITARGSREDLTELINRISTNFSYFYREKAHFDFLIQVALPEWKRKLTSRGKDLRIWTAGCSTGEEPYTIIMLLFEAFGIEYTSWNPGVLATDISQKALQIANKGIYPADRLQKLPRGLRDKYFLPEQNGNVEIRERVRKEVTFRCLNLMNPEFSFKRPFHIIFCRNVMIYFDQKTRESLAQRFYNCLTPGGYLFIGHSETLGREQKNFDYVIPAAYRKKMT